MSAPKHDSTDAAKPLTQSEKFRDLARQLGANEDEAAFEDVVRKIAEAEKAPPKRGPAD